MNNIIKLSFIIIIALSVVACGDKTPTNNTTVIIKEPATSNPIAQPDALEKAKQIEGIMKKDEVTQKQAIDAK